MAGPVYEIFVVAIVAGTLRELIFKITMFKIFFNFQSTPLNKKTYKENIQITEK